MRDLHSILVSTVIHFSSAATIRRAASKSEAVLVSDHSWRLILSFPVSDENGGSMGSSKTSFPFLSDIEIALLLLIY